MRGSMPSASAPILIYCSNPGSQSPVDTAADAASKYHPGGVGAGEDGYMAGGIDVRNSDRDRRQQAD